MTVIRIILSISCFIILAGCSDTFLRAMDEFNAGMGGQRTCTREAPYETDSYKGYSYKTGGLCNIWQGQIINRSNYTVRCTNTIGGRRANTIIASPRQTTELKQIGHMSGGSLNYTCNNWARSAYVWKKYPKRNYQIILKMSSGKQYMTIRNTANSNKRCYLKNSNKQILVEGRVNSGQMLQWVPTPNNNFYSNCV
ncbi:hypothetical protein [Kangiella sediminilitoris]|uniref:Lipoprotein n=1 Tax=Kangiella sediminilitoris TaxID=1144748 RepID=A0A1B3BB05_9GAMM|nr:hypothetical protein [Kangiella sediminilitoris]AOE49980.1 hypothetical protein KS2013_1263 [Kangiella sediminilitoris]